MKQFGRLYDIISDRWFTEEPTRIVWFLRILDSMDSDGKVDMSRAKFGRLFNCTAKAAYYFLTCLEKRGIITLVTSTNSTIISIVSPDDYDEVERNLGAKRAQQNTCKSKGYNKQGRNLGAIWAQNEQDEQQGLDLGVIKAQENSCNTDDYDEVGRNLGAKRAQGTRKENGKERSLSPIPPITKEKIKEKKPLTRGYAPDFVGDVSSADAKELEKQRKVKERKKRNEEKKQKTMTLVHKAREKFEKYYQELFDSSYYWDVKDAVAMKRLLQKIAFARTNRERPLPCDDESLLQALETFLRMINKSWLMNNFSVCKIDSQYNEIVSEIKNKKKPNQNVQRNTTVQETSTAILAGQAANLLNDIAKADALYYRGEYGSSEPAEANPVDDNIGV